MILPLNQRFQKESKMLCFSLRCPYKAVLLCLHYGWIVVKDDGREKGEQ
jgi:hypothetical protein